LRRKQPFPSGTLIYATLASPIIGAAIGTILFAAIAVMVPFAESEPQTIVQLVLNVIFIALGSIYYGGMIGVPAMLILGIPAHVVFQRLGFRALPWYAISGLLCGLSVYFLCVAALTKWWPTANDYVLYEPGVFVLAASIGFMTGTSFWLIRRPDRDAPDPRAGHCS
jgi:hypothetical protein